MERRVGLEGRVGHPVGAGEVSPVVVGVEPGVVEGIVVEGGGALDPGRHCEYQSFNLVHTAPEIHVVAPDQPAPPHWAYICCCARAGRASTRATRVCLNAIFLSEELLFFAKHAAPSVLHPCVIYEETSIFSISTRRSKRRPARARILRATHESGASPVTWQCAIRGSIAPILPRTRECVRVTDRAYKRSSLLNILESNSEKNVQVHYDRTKLAVLRNCEGVPRPRG